MNVLVVIYHPTDLQLYSKALELVDIESQSRINKFYRREDACRTLLGRLMIRMVLKSLSFDLRDVRFDKTETGKPFMVSGRHTLPIGLTDLFWPCNAVVIITDVAYSYRQLMAPGLM